MKSKNKPPSLSILCIIDKGIKETVANKYIRNIKKKVDVINFNNYEISGSLKVSFPSKEVSLNAYHWAENFFEKLGTIALKGYDVTEALKKDMSKFNAIIQFQEKIRYFINREGHKYGEIIIITKNNALQSIFRSRNNISIINARNAVKEELHNMSLLLRCLPSFFYEVTNEKKKKYNLLEANYVFEIPTKTMHRVVGPVVDKLLDKSIILLDKTNSKRIEEFNRFIESNKKYNGKIEYLSVRGSFISLLYNTLTYIKLYFNLKERLKDEPFIFDFIIGKLYAYMRNINRFGNLIKTLYPKKLIILREFSGLSNILTNICKKHNIEIINCQHGGIYYGNNYFDKFLVFGKYFKDEYTKHTRSPEEQFHIVGTPSFDILQDFVLDRAVPELEDVNKNLRVLTFYDQPIKGLITRELKLETREYLKKILKDYRQIFLIIKKHPDTTDNTWDDLSSHPRVKVYREEYDLGYFLHYSDVTLTCYSTVGIESVVFGRPTILINPSGILDVLITNVLKKYSVDDYSSFENIISNILSSPNYIKEMLEEQKEMVSQYYFFNDEKAADRYMNLIR